MHSALDDLELDQLYVVHAAGDSFPLGDRVRAVAARAVLDELDPATSPA